MKTADIGAAMHRRLAQLKITARLLEHEMDLAKDGKDLTLDRALAEALLDTLEIYIEDFDSGFGGSSRESGRQAENAKPAVTRLN